MIATTIAFLILLTILVLPGWHKLGAEKRRYSLLLALPGFGVVFWFFLTMNGMGSQSLSNLIEVPIVAVFGVGMSYFGFWVPLKGVRSGNTIITIALFTVLMLAVLGLRQFMPSLPE